ncbi:ABC transporter permease [Rhodococcus sp. BP-252]|uniref:ABC transporter n=1 Tax=Rhodococcoides kyotonense TaxID=398843 RepID=A0A177YJ20_9NOCA|nr:MULTISPECIES: ABC transporter permease [Rhodococcus]MBY6410799.1 ABC transporter permease [Rhodococcus sp. BP-320]MBY6415376.1 ABC transporter permease [Rhodococcus sp. BP-321]MBY6419991.1 ABC transporter permease [Rhodococcus sp. BP-324]MBY6425355.1 ABC transporter permease [Rhodococcus sp. BP-323]MBY6430582.1 ABC transporter permease [Rhodococcus sp. BP-322]
MSFELPVARGPGRDLANQIGGLVAFSVTAIQRTITTVVRGRLSLEETITQALFVARVCTVPALLLMLPIGVLIAVSVGSLAGRLGAGAYSGAVVAFVVVGQAAALVCALMLAGVAGSAICADLGSRTIREEIAAMEVMGLDVVERLVVPRLIASAVVSLAICAMVTAVGVGACFFYQVFVADQSAGAFLATFSEYGRVSDFTMAMIKSVCFAVTSTLVASFKGLHAKGGPSGVADAVNEAVVLAFVLAFVVNTVLSQLYSVAVPAVGTY